MKRNFTWALLALTLAGPAMVAGCSKAPTTDEPAAEEPAAEDSASSDDAATKEDDPFASLTAAEKTAVLAQKICPVTGEDLGSMGPPIKVVVEGNEYWVCCDACVEPLQDEPENYLAKLGPAAPAEATEGGDADDTPPAEEPEETPGEKLEDAEEAARYAWPLSAMLI